MQCWYLLQNRFGLAVALFEMQRGLRNKNFKNFMRSWRSDESVTAQEMSTKSALPFINARL